MFSMRNRNIFIGISVIIVIIIILILLILYVTKKQSVIYNKQEELMQKKTTQPLEIIKSNKADSIKQNKILEIKPDTPAVFKVGKEKKIKNILQPAKDSLSLSLIDSLKKQTDTQTIPTVDTFSQIYSPCSDDTVSLWVYPEPSGGLHRGIISVKFYSTKKCTIEWRRNTESEYKIYSEGDTINILSNTTLYFRAFDSCGNKMEEREEIYEIADTQTKKNCPFDMEYINVGTTSFCIDKYEWPNKLKSKPLSFISFYSAMDSCVSKGKRLCTSDEWTLACTGPYGWKYPYGNKYEIRACVSNDTIARPSGSKPECRGYFEVFDMSGNLAEWTNTKSQNNPQFYNVKGGFWASGTKSGCFDVHYSYYPQNKHNSVGFRCCKDIEIK